MKFSDFRKGDLVFSDGNRARVWTVVKTADTGVMLDCTHFRNGDKVGEKLGVYKIGEPTWFTGNPKILHVVSRSAKVV